MLVPKLVTTRKHYDRTQFFRGLARFGDVIRVIPQAHIRRRVALATE